jgi:hypothetical protein
LSPKLLKNITTKTISARLSIALHSRDEHKSEHREVDDELMHIDKAQTFVMLHHSWPRESPVQYFAAMQHCVQDLLPWICPQLLSHFAISQVGRNKKLQDDNQRS